LLIKQFDCPQNCAPCDLQAVLRYLANRVGVRVVAFALGVKTWSPSAVLSVDHIYRWDTGHTRLIRPHYAAQPDFLVSRTIQNWLAAQNYRMLLGNLRGVIVYLPPETATRVKEALLSGNLIHACPKWLGLKGNHKRKRVVF
jgi:hypothetical protein